MSLDALVIARYSVQRLKEMSNPDDGAAGAYSAAKLAAACADAIGDFQTYVGVPWVEADASHVRPAVERAYALLVDRMDPASALATTLLTNSFQQLLDIAPLIGRGVRVAPQTDSRLTPSQVDISTGRPVRPEFDEDRFLDIIPDPNPRDRDS